MTATNMFDSLRLSLYFFLLRFRDCPGSAWNQLKREGWYSFYTKNDTGHGYVLSNGAEWTEPQEFETLEDFLSARERYAQKILDERR